MRVMILSLLLVAAFAAQPALADDTHGCSLREGPDVVKASFRTGVSVRRNERAPVCLRETRPLTPSCFSATSMLTQ